METRKLHMKVKRTKKKKNVFRKTDKVDKKILPPHSKCESKYISSNRLTRRIGLYNQGKISYLVSRCEEASSPRMKARVQEDLHKILNLGKDCDLTNDIADKSVNENRLGMVKNPRKKALHDKHSSLSSLVLKSPVKMDVDDPSPELTPMAAAILQPSVVYLKNVSSAETLERSAIQSSSNLDSLFSSSSKPENKDSLEAKMRNPEMSNFVDHCITIWASHLLPDIQPVCKNKGKEVLNGVTLQYRQGEAMSGPSTSSQTATKAICLNTRAISSSSEGKSSSHWSLSEKSNSSSLKDHNKQQQNSSQEIGHDSTLNFNRLFVNSSASSLRSSDNSDYENAEVWSSIDDEDLTFISCESGLNFSLSPSPKFSPVKRPSEKVETPKLFFRHKLY